MLGKDARPKNGVLTRSPRPKDYISGGVSACPWEEVNELGEWVEYKSEPHEMQLVMGVDLAMCTNFAATDTVESIIKHLYGDIVNYNERALAVMSGQKMGGNYLEKVAETIRTVGLVPQELHPWNPSKHNTYSKMITASSEEMNDWKMAGQIWLDTYEVKWEWIYDDYGPSMRKALKCAPLFVASLYAYESAYRNGVYTTSWPNCPKTTHATVLMAHEEDYKWVDDSYSTQIKKLDVDFRVPMGIRFWIRHKVTKPNNMLYPPSNSAVVVTDTGERLMYIGGDNIYKDDTGKIHFELVARNAKDGRSHDFPLIHVKSSEISHLMRINLKGEETYG